MINTDFIILKLINNSLRFYVLCNDLKLKILEYRFKKIMILKKSSLSIILFQKYECLQTTFKFFLIKLKIHYSI